MRLRKSLIISALGMFFSLAYAGSPDGDWTTVDESGTKRAVIHLTVADGKMNGYVAGVFPQPGDSPTCDKCPGSFKGKQVKGMRIIWGLQDKGQGEWVDGKILDPKSGKIYNANMTLKGNKLHVRGFIGVSLLGRTQVWVR